MHTAHPSVSPKPNPPKTTDLRTFDDGRIVLYKRTDYRKPVWVCRIKVPGNKGYIIRSTKCLDLNKAYGFADGLFFKTLGAVASGQDINSKHISKALKAYTDHIEETEPSSPSRKAQLSYLRRWQGYVGSCRLNEFDTAKIADLFERTCRDSKTGKLANTTVRRFSVHLKAFLKWCVTKGYLAQVPAFPKTKKAGKVRPHFEMGDINRLKRFMTGFADVVHPIARRDRRMLVNYVMILLNTGIRVGEARSLKWRDLSAFSPEGSDHKELSLTVSGKTGKRTLVAMPGTDRLFARIFELRTEELGQAPRKDSYVFCHPDGKPIGHFRKGFDRMIEDCGIATDSHGNKRTIYSLRHTYATSRLMSTVDVFALAKNMGTSVAMIEKHYGHTTNISAAKELTKI